MITDSMMTILEIAHYHTFTVAKIVAIFPRFYDLNDVFEFLIVFTVVHVDEFFKCSPKKLIDT